MDNEFSPPFSVFFSFAGISAAVRPCAQHCKRIERLTIAQMILGCAGAAFGTAKSGIGISGIGTYRPDLIMKVRSPSPAQTRSFSIRTN